MENKVYNSWITFFIGLKITIEFNYLTFFVHILSSINLVDQTTTQYIFRVVKHVLENMSTHAPKRATLNI